jgi:hypothetical protein
MRGSKARLVTTAIVAASRFPFPRLYRSPGTSIGKSIDYLDFATIELPGPDYLTGRLAPQIGPGVLHSLQGSTRGVERVPPRSTALLQLLAEIAPALKRAAFMFNPDTALASSFMPSLETAARSLKVEPIIAHIHSDAEIETAIIALGREPGAALLSCRMDS